jgi:hypothetical protein
VKDGYAKGKADALKKGEIKMSEADYHKEPCKHCGKTVYAHRRVGSYEADSEKCHYEPEESKPEIQPKCASASSQTALRSSVAKPKTTRNNHDAKQMQQDKEGR